MAKIHGMDQVLTNLNRELKKIKGANLAGLISAAVVIRRDMDKTSPKIPIDTGNLRASWFISSSGGDLPAGADPGFKGEDADRMSSGHSKVIQQASSFMKGFKGHSVVMGFTAYYAWYVHEMVGANFSGQPDKVKYTKAGKITSATKKYTRREGAGAKFFEASLKRNYDKILETVARKAKI
jgi:hypothetical protein